MALKNTRIINGEGRPRLIVRKGTTYQSPGNKGETYGPTSAKIPLARGVSLNGVDEYLAKSNPIDLDLSGPELSPNTEFADLTGWVAEGNHSALAGINFKTGKLGQCIYIDQFSSTVHDLLSFSRGTQISGNNYANVNTNQGSISFWMKTDWNWNDGFEHYILTLAQPSADFVVYKSDGNVLRFQVNGVVLCAYSGASSLVKNTWYHIVVRWDADAEVATSKYAQIFVNGVEQASRATSFTTVAPGATAYIGSRGSATPALGGYIDDLGISDRVATDAEISALYNSGTGATYDSVMGDSHLKFYASFDGTVGTAVVGTALAGGAGNMWTGNLAADGTMEAVGVTNWVDVNTPVTKAKETSVVLFDTQSLKIVGDAAGDGAGQTIAVVNGSTYHIEIYAKATAGSVVIDILDNVTLVAQKVISGDWEKFETEVKMASTSLVIRFTQYDATAATFYIDGVCVVQNKVANGGFEGTYVSGVAPNYNGWLTGAHLTLSESATAYTGSKSQSIQITSSFGGVEQTISRTVDKFYLFLLAFRKAASGSSTAIRISDGATNWSKYFNATAAATWYRGSHIRKTASGESATIAIGHGNVDTVLIDDFFMWELSSIDLTITPITVAEVTASAAGAVSTDRFRVSSPTLSQNNTYTLEFWAKSISGNTTLNARDSGNEIQNSATLIQTWQKFVFNNLKPGATGLTYPIFYLGGTGTFRIDKVRLHRDYKWSWAFWINHSDQVASGFERIFELYGTNVSFWVGFESGTRKAYYKITDADLQVAQQSSLANVADGKWHLIVVTLDRIANQFTLYIDGIVDRTISVTSIGSLFGLVNLRYGTTPVPPAILGESQIIQERCLSLSDNQQILTSGVPSSWATGSVKAHFKFIGVSDAEMLADLSGTGNDLTGNNVTQADDQVVADYPSATERLSLKGIKVGMMASSLITGSPDKPVYGRITSVDDPTHTLGIDEWKGGIPTNLRQLTIDGFVIDLPRCQEMTEIFAPDVLVHKLYRSRKDSKHRGWTYRCILDYSKLTTGDMLVDMIQALNLGEEDNLILIPRVDVPGFQYNVFYAEPISLTKARGRQGYKKPVFVFDAEDPLASWPILDGYGSGYALNWGHQE